MIIIKRYGSLWDKVISRNNILKAIRKSSRRNGRVSANKRHMIKLIKSNPDIYVDSINKMLSNGSFKTSNYFIYPIFDPKLRLIYCLPFYPDRVVHHAIMNVLESIWDNRMISSSYACRKGRGQHKAGLEAMQYVKKYKYCLQCDISQFYTNIDHDILKSIIRKKIKDSKLLSFLDEIIDSISTRKINLRILRRMKDNGCACKDIPKNIEKIEKYIELCNGNLMAGLPIGNYTSQWLGNVYMNEFDMFIKHDLRCKPYIRYCDDFILFSDSKEELHNWREDIEVFLWDRLRMSLSKSKVFPTTQGLDFLGYRYFHQGYILLRKRTAREVLKRFKGIENSISIGLDSSNIELIRGQVASAKGWLKWANSKHFRDKIHYDDIARVVNSYEEI